MPATAPVRFKKKEAGEHARRPYAQERRNRSSRNGHASRSPVAEATGRREKVRRAYSAASAIASPLLNWAASVESDRAVVEAWPPEIAMVTASK